MPVLSPKSWQSAVIGVPNTNFRTIKLRPEQPVSRILFPLQVTPKRTTTIHLRMRIALHLMRPTRELGRAALRHSPIWSCTGWGLQSFPGHPENWCALTAPFHPYPAEAGRYIFCCTFLHVAATPRYGAPCPAVFGLSSGPESGPAVVWIAPAVLHAFPQ